MDENAFRIALAGVLVGTMAVVLYRRIQAAKSGERISRREEGLSLAIVLRVAAAVMWLGIFAYMANPEWMAWSALPLPDWLRWLGLAIGVLGISFVYWTLAHLGKNLTDTVVTRSNATLVTTGPYRYVRHPFYIGAALIFLSATLLTANATIAVSGFICLALLVVRTNKEEAQLLARFGEQYRVYQQTTGRFFPRTGGGGSHQ